MLNRTSEATKPKLLNIIDLFRKLVVVLDHIDEIRAGEQSSKTPIMRIPEGRGHDICRRLVSNQVAPTLILSFASGGKAYCSESGCSDSSGSADHCLKRSSGTRGGGHRS